MAPAGSATGSKAVPQPLVEKPVTASPVAAAEMPRLPIPRAGAQADASTVKASPVPELHVSFVWRDGTSDERKVAILADNHLLPNGASFGRLLSYKLLTTDDEATVHARLSTIPELTMLSVVKPARLQFVPGDGYYPYQWDMKQMGLEQAWDITRGSASICVAVIDSGVQLNHEELAGRLVDGYDGSSGFAVGTFPGAVRCPMASGQARQS
jgi:subtilisin family serine protease